MGWRLAIAHWLLVIGYWLLDAPLELSPYRLIASSPYRSRAADFILSPGGRVAASDNNKKR